MGTGWRRAFCTTVRRDRDGGNQRSCSSSPSTPRSCVKLGFLSSASNPSTPRPLPSSSPGLRCRTGETPTAEDSRTTTPRSARKSPRFLAAGSNPSSPRSPLKLSLFKNSFKFRSSCGVCLNSVKSGQGTAIYTAECSHAFHFPCIADHVRKHGKLVCPVCSAVWKDASLLSAHVNYRNAIESPNAGGISVKTGASRSETEEKKFVESSPRTAVNKLHPRIKDEYKSMKTKLNPADVSRFYDDDEPLLTPRFIPIPEADDEINGSDGNEEEFKGFVVNPDPFFAVRSPEMPINSRDSRNVQVALVQESAVISVYHGYETHAVALRIKAPPPPRPIARGMRNSSVNIDPSHRAPVDLVAVLDVGVTVNSAKLQMLKRAMRLVVSSLGPVDRLSIVAFSSAPKRVLPLKRMTDQGKRTALRVVDHLVCGQGCSSVNDALSKATRVLEDRRDRNPVASIVLLSDGQDDRIRCNVGNQQSGSNNHSTRFAHIEIPVHETGFGRSGGLAHEPAEEAFAKCVGGLLSVVVQDLRIQLSVGSGSAPCEISAVYLSNGPPMLVGSGSSSVRLGNLYADEERELLVELRVPAEACGSRHVLSVRCLYKDPSTQEVVYGRDQAHPVPQAVRSTTPGNQRLRNVFVTTRAVAESRRLVEHGEFNSAHHLLTSARAMLTQSGSASEFVKGIEAELADVHWRRQQMVDFQQQQIMMTTTIQRRRGSEKESTMVMIDENGEPLTPSSAWRAAEKLAKVAMMRKSLNSDLHGFENARF